MRAVTFQEENAGIKQPPTVDIKIDNGFAVVHVSRRMHIIRGSMKGPIKGSVSVTVTAIGPENPCRDVCLFSGIALTQAADIVLDVGNFAFYVSSENSVLLTGVMVADELPEFASGATAVIEPCPTVEIVVLNGSAVLEMSRSLHVIRGVMPEFDNPSPGVIVTVRKIGFEHSRCNVCHFHALTANINIVLEANTTYQFEVSSQKCVKLTGVWC